MCVCMCLCMVHVCARSEDNLWEMVLSFHSVRHGIQTQVVGFSGLHRLSHLAGPVSASQQLPTPVCNLHVLLKLLTWLLSLCASLRACGL